MAKGYTLDQLSPEARKRALEELRETDFDRSDELKDLFHNDLEMEFFPTQKIYFSLGYTQGDGVSFYGPFDDLKAFLKEHKLWTRFKKLEPYISVQIDGGRYSSAFGPGTMHVEYELNVGPEDLIPESISDDIAVWEKEERARYRQWEVKTQRRLPKEGPKEWRPKHTEPFEARPRPPRFRKAEERARAKTAFMEKEAEELQAEIQDLVEDMSWRLEKMGYGEIEYWDSEEYLTEMADANDYKFSKEGEWL